MNKRITLKEAVLIDGVRTPFLRSQTEFKDFSAYDLGRLVVSRMLLVMVNEAVLTLQDEILMNPGDGDLSAILGLGFPAYLGGPFRYIDRVGPSAVLSELSRLQEKNGPRFTPAPLFRDMAAEGSRFYD